ncbi:type VI secretion system baseplate subunit TssK [Pseudoduganella sp. LjRoot289]|uniref:type VI secretion system baseplate subunit TssK n=1 Tax=Pseudoduganella sp. LjRoot289 TaxID=3342314 RepID=UPI003ECD67B6
MSTAAKVLWGLGQLVRPQHFQQQDRYHEARLQRIAQALQPHYWGVQALEWDQLALKANVLRLHRLSAIFRDGELSDAPACDPLPPAVDLGTLKAEVQEVTYYAALPPLSPDGGNCAPEGARHQDERYAQTSRSTADMYTQAAAQELSYLHKAVRLVSDQEPLGGYECVPLIRLRRVVSGGFEADPAFIPPSLSVEASPRLKAQLEQLLDALQAKVHALQGHMREPSRNVIEFRSGDMSAFWLLHTVSSAGAQLMHYQRHPELHPERLFEAMLELTGALMTYSKSYQLTALPSYEHKEPGECFARLDAIIRDLLDTVISSRCFSIALIEEKSCYHKGQLDSGKIDQKTTLYLAVGAAMPALELVAAVPLRFKVGAPDDVDQCVLSAMPGVKLSHAPQVPAAIPVRPGTCYFVLENKGVLYEQMLKAQSVTIFAPAGMSDLRIELIAVTA